MTQKPDYALIYSQRYETYRYLDRTRWFLMQFGVTAASAFFVFLPEVNGNSRDIAFLSVGSVLLFSSAGMLKVSDAISKNSKVLSDAGQNIGDMHVPKTKVNLFSISNVAAVLMLIVGCASILVGAVGAVR